MYIYTYIYIYMYVHVYWICIGALRRKSNRPKLRSKKCSRPTIDFKSVSGVFCVLQVLGKKRAFESLPFRLSGHSVSLGETNFWVSALPPLQSSKLDSSKEPTIIYIIYIYITIHNIYIYIYTHYKYQNCYQFQKYLDWTINDFIFSIIGPICPLVGSGVSGNDFL